MIEKLKSREVVDKVGGKFILTALIQRRMQELMQGGRPLVENTKGMTQMEIVVEEILQDKIAVEYEDESVSETRGGPLI